MWHRQSFPLPCIVDAHNVVRTGRPSGLPGRGRDASVFVAVAARNGRPQRSPGHAPQQQSEREKTDGDIAVGGRRPDPTRAPIQRAAPWARGFRQFKTAVGTRVLEDFVGLRRVPSIQTFYGLLRRIHGTASVNESCDCALRGPTTIISTTRRYLGAPNNIELRSHHLTEIF